jgi:hypothetical protein
MFWELLLLLAATTPDTLIGNIRVVKGAPTHLDVLLINDAKSILLQGDLAAELAHVASCKVEVVGVMSDAAFVVRDYRIIDVGDGARPLVGALLLTGSGRLALRDGEGGVISLSVPPQTQAKMHHDVGSKVWIYGNKLLSGELRVSRYGILHK